MLIRKQSLIVGYALATLELSHKSAIEEYKLQITVLLLNTFFGMEKQGEYMWLLVVFLQVSALIRLKKKLNSNAQDKLRIWKMKTNLLESLKSK